MQLLFPEQVLQAFGLNAESISTDAFGSGLIHKTYILRNPDGVAKFVLQQVNHHVFKKPLDIAHNLEVIGRFIKHEHPDYLFTLPIRTQGDFPYAIHDGNYYRLFSFVPGSITYDTCPSPELAYEAAKQFGLFTSILEGIPMDMLRFTIPGFHDLSMRFRQFEEAHTSASRDRLALAEEAIKRVQGDEWIVSTFEKLRTDPGFKLRVTHHDTKISNVLFDEKGRGLCVIDLDTVMPGYFISDVGDMMRTYLSPVNEESQDFQSIESRDDFFEGIVNGYLEGMRGKLTTLESAHLVYAGKFITYMQAIRFLADYLNNDRYYGARYEGHNLARAENQLCLLDRIKEKDDIYERIVRKYLPSDKS